MLGLSGVESSRSAIPEPEAAQGRSAKNAQRLTWRPAMETQVSVCRESRGSSWLWSIFGEWLLNHKLMCGEWIEGSEGNNKGLGENCGETCRALDMEVEVTSNSDLILETDNFLA